MRHGVMVSTWDFGSYNSGSNPDAVVAKKYMYGGKRDGKNKQNKGSIKAFTDKEKHYKHGGNKAI